MPSVGLPQAPRDLQLATGDELPAGRGRTGLYRHGRASANVEILPTVPRAMIQQTKGAAAQQLVSVSLHPWSSKPAGTKGRRPYGRIRNAAPLPLATTPRLLLTGARNGCQRWRRRTVWPEGWQAQDDGSGQMS